MSAVFLSKLLKTHRNEMTLAPWPRFYHIHSLTPHVRMSGSNSPHLFLSMLTLCVFIYFVCCWARGWSWVSGGTFHLFEKSFTEPRPHCFCFTGWPPDHRDSAVFLLPPLSAFRRVPGPELESCVCWQLSILPAPGMLISFQHHTSSQSKSPRFLKYTLW